jgi:NTE family protein
MQDVHEKLGGAVFEALTQSERERLLAVAKPRRLERGEVLFAEGDAADRLFIVSRGAIVLKQSNVPVGEARTGDLVGETAFFARRPHRLTATALRQAEVLELSRRAWERLVQDLPAIAGTFLDLTARRLHEVVGPGDKPATDHGLARTTAFVMGGYARVPVEFQRRMSAALGRAGVTVIDRDTITDRFGPLAPDDDLVGAWLDWLERSGRQIVLFAEPDLTSWTEMCVRNADEVVMVTTGDAPAGTLTPIEKLVEATHEAARRRLVRIHRRREGVLSGTAAWLERLPVKMHHHVSLQDDADLDAVARFITGRAIGYVAGGGGGFGAAHMGIFHAFQEKGATFDILVGTSVGAAFLAGFAILADYERVSAGTHDIHVKSRSLKRYTMPRYALLDHKVYDESLARAYGESVRVEDCWRPFAAVATNLSTNSMELIRTGLLWQAVRASTAIPCVLTPFFTRDGEMLVDGAIMDDAPLAPMQSLKTGPNLVVHFGRTERPRFDFAYEDLPGRGRLLASLFNPRARLPRAPKLMSMLFRLLLAHQRYDLPVGPHDLVLTPPAFPGGSMLSFDRHRQVSDAAYAWALKMIEQLSATGDPGVAAVLGRPDAGVSMAVAA